jgi:hypothetical protein
MRRRALAVLVALAGALLGASPAHALVIGIGDQKPDMFSDERFVDLDIRYARYMIPWDVMRVPADLARLTDWLDAAKAAGVQPLLTFGHSLRPDKRRTMPTPAQFRAEFVKLRRAFPWVRTFATWNEANHCGEPYCHKPEKAAELYRALSASCPKCTILAAELLDEPNMVDWVKAFVHELGWWPRYWGLHNYLDANRWRTVGTQSLLDATKHSQIWLTETGGVVARRNASTITFPMNTRHAAQSLSWIFRDLVPLSRRITRVYLYEWSASTSYDTWDSALINPHGKIRPAFTVLSNEQRRLVARAKSEQGAGPPETTETTTTAGPGLTASERTG